jgi:hypothetical protein
MLMSQVPAMVHLWLYPGKTKHVVPYSRSWEQDHSISNGLDVWHKAMFLTFLTKYPSEI